LGGPLAGMRLSPDGKRLAITVGQPKSDIFIFDLIQGTKTRITFTPAQNIQPSWSPDGQRIVYSELAGSRLTLGSTIHDRLANGGGQDELLVGPESNVVPVTFS